MRPQQNYSSNVVGGQSANTQNQMTLANKAYSDCGKQNRETPSGKIVTSSILVSSDAQPNKLELLSSKSKLNESQKKAFKQFLSDTNRCRNMRLDDLKGTPYLSLVQKDFASKDVIYGKLLSGQMAIGDANAALKQINIKTGDDMRAVNPQPVRPQPVATPQTPAGPGNVIGQTFDSQANGNIYLYDGPCKLPNYAISYPLRWDAKRADNGSFIAEGCYTLNQQQVTMIAGTGLTVSRPMSLFQGGGKSVFQSFSEGLQRATTYWNNSAAETQRNTTNLTPGMTGGNGMNCTPDGRGGYNCR
ncbi:hypothetical protein PKF022_05430 [Polynucleobacter sp. KF022]|nr:hypothetical protein PKF022_05430 [Polynucleobacter sp. KF022]